MVVGFDRETCEKTSVFRAPFGFGFRFALSSVAWGDDLVLMSAFFGTITLFDQASNVNIAEGPVPPSPVDAQIAASKDDRF